MSKYFAKDGYIFLPVTPSPWLKRTTRNPIASEIEKGRTFVVSMNDCILTTRDLLDGEEMILNSSWSVIYNYRERLKKFSNNYKILMKEIAQQPRSGVLLISDSNTAYTVHLEFKTIQALETEVKTIFLEAKRE